MADKEKDSSSSSSNSSSEGGLTNQKQFRLLSIDSFYSYLMNNSSLSTNQTSVNFAQSLPLRISGHNYDEEKPTAQIKTLW